MKLKIKKFHTAGTSWLKRRYINFYLCQSIHGMDPNPPILASLESTKFSHILYISTSDGYAGPPQWSDWAITYYSGNLPQEMQKETFKKLKDFRDRLLLFEFCDAL